MRISCIIKPPFPLWNILASDRQFCFVLQVNNQFCSILNPGSRVENLQLHTRSLQILTIIRRCSTPQYILYSRSRNVNSLSLFLKYFLKRSIQKQILNSNTSNKNSKLYLDFVAYSYAYMGGSLECMKNHLLQCYFQWRRQGEKTGGWTKGVTKA